MNEQNPYSDDDTVWVASGSAVHCDSLDFLQERFGEEIEIRKSGDTVVVDAVQRDTRERIDKIFTQMQMFERKPRSDV